MPPVAKVAPEAARLAIAVFEHRAFRGPLRLLRPGFRHCFCLVRVEAGWLLCDPLKASLRLDVLPPYDPNGLAAHYAVTGRHVLIGLAPAYSPPGRVGLRPLSCVEVVKRALALDAPGILTPWQLYNKLLSTRNWLER